MRFRGLGIWMVLAVCLSVARAQTNTFPASGNVGIGTTVPASLLSVNNGNNVSATLQDWEITSTPILNVGYLYSPIVGPATLDTGDGSRSLVFQQSGGNVGIGTVNPGATLEVNGNVKLSTNSGASITFQDGTTQSTAYTGVTCGGDYAESVDVTGDRSKYEPGDVLVIDPSVSGKFLKSAEPYSRSVTGIYSTRPGTVGRRQMTPKAPEEVPMAMIGIVPTKVTAENGPIHRGDLLVSSSTVGYAMKGTDYSRMTGAIIGKALGDLESGKGVIEIVVTLQ